MKVSSCEGDLNGYVCTAVTEHFDIALALERAIDRCQTDLANMSAADVVKDASTRPSKDGAGKKFFALPRGAPHPTPERMWRWGCYRSEEQ